MVKIIKHTGEINDADDPSLPFRLDLMMRVPSFMSVAFVMLHGGAEEVIARANTVEELVKWMDETGLRHHPRLLRFQITKGDTVVVGVDGKGGLH